MMDEEQEIRDGFGYAESESRSKDERDAAAARMVSRSAGSTEAAELVWRAAAERVRDSAGRDARRMSRSELDAFLRGPR